MIVVQSSCVADQPAVLSGMALDGKLELFDAAASLNPLKQQFVSPSINIGKERVQAVASSQLFGAASDELFGERIDPGDCSVGTSQNDDAGGRF